MIKYYLTAALRNIRINKIISLIKITGLGLGTGLFGIVSITVSQQILRATRINPVRTLRDE